MTIKAAFFDIDGTLISFKTHKVPQSTISALTKAKQNGIKIFISTGRPVALINNINDIKHLVDGYITFNGAYCFMGNREFVLSPIPESDVQTMLADAEKRNYCVAVCGKKEVIIHNYKKVNYYVSLNISSFPQFSTWEDKWEYLLSMPLISPKKKSIVNFHREVKKLLSSNEHIPSDILKKIIETLKSHISSNELSEYSRVDYLKTISLLEQKEV